MNVKAPVLPIKTESLEYLVAITAAIKKVLSPNSLNTLARKAPKNGPFLTTFSSRNAVAYGWK